MEGAIQSAIGIILSHFVIASFSEMSATLPRTMRALVQVKRVKDFKQADLASCFQVQEVDVPVPQPGNVLVKVESAAIHPSNLATLQGLYADSGSKPLPVRMGTEGSGTVVASGGGWWAWWLQGKRVGALAPTGMWAEYVEVPAQRCVVLPDDVSFEAGTSCFVNPLTAMSFVQIAQAAKSRAIVHTAAASVLGQMLVRYSAEQGIDVICVVRREEQVNLLRQIGAKYIVNTSTDSWQDELRQYCTDLKAKVGFECVGGALPGQIQACMPSYSELFVYGNLTGEPWANMAPGDLRYHQKKITGYWLPEYLKAQSSWTNFSMLSRVSSRLLTSFSTDFGATYSLDEATEAFQSYSGKMTGAKPRFTL